MEMWDKQPRDNRNRNRRENPSFSSTLLDSIYRSIDEPNGELGLPEEELIFYRETTSSTTATAMRKIKQSQNTKTMKETEQMTSLQRACMIEKWMEKKVSCHNNNNKSMAMPAPDKKSSRNHDPMLLNSSSTSSDSSCGTTGGFSSSESDSFYSAKTSSSASTTNHHHYTISHRPKPIRTTCVVSARPQHDEIEKPNGFVSTKSKALKIYSDLKKVKQPISPGGKLASFLNSLFSSSAARHPKKAKISSKTGYEERKLKSETVSTCSSASSFSRSCLSKTPSSRGKLSSNNNNGTTKRSVRFCPVSVILDEDSRPCGHKNIQLHGNRELIECRIMEENRRVMEAAKDLLKNYQKKKEEYNMRDICTSYDDNDDEDEDDAASYASSDLFELDNLSSIGIQRYREELPVYETTHLDTNRATANGLLV